MNVEYKGYQIVGDGTFGFKEIKPTGKGSVHLELRGSYTTSKQAELAIDRHLAKEAAKPKKGAVKDAENK